MLCAQEPLSSPSSSGSPSPPPHLHSLSALPFSFPSASSSRSSSSCSSSPSLHLLTPATFTTIPTSINKLPSELLSHILRYLTSRRELRNCSLVSRRWCHHTVPLLWQKPAHHSFAALLKWFRTLKTDSPTFPYATFVNKLNFSNFADQVFDVLILNLPECIRLERLTLAGCGVLTPTSLVSLSACENLLALDLSSVEEVDDSVLNALAQKCIKLSTVNLMGCYKVTDDGIRNLAIGCPQLRKVKLAKCDQVTDYGVITVIERCPSLLELDLSSCSRITNETVRAIFQKCSQLRELRLIGDAAINDEPFTELEPMSFEQLRGLDMSMCPFITDHAVQKIVAACPRLRTVAFAKCALLTDASAAAIAKLGKTLRYLYLGHCVLLTDRAVRRIRACTRLRYVDFACCSKLTDVAAADLSTLPKLKRVGLVKCTRLTDAGILALTRTWSDSEERKDGEQSPLERIHLSYCVNLTLPAIRRLLRACPHLNHLSLTGVPPFVTPSLQRFCRPPPRSYSPGQREVFCVFCGRGVTELRIHLTALRAEELENMNRQNDRRDLEDLRPMTLTSR